LQLKGKLPYSTIRASKGEKVRKFPLKVVGHVAMMEQDQAANERKASVFIRLRQKVLALRTLLTARTAAQLESC